MKYLKLILPYDNDRKTLVYPPNYQKEIGDFNVNHLYYEENFITKLLLSIQDKNFDPSMVRDNVEEVSETEANLISESNQTRTLKINDEAMVRAIEIKLQLKSLKNALDKLTPEEKAEDILTVDELKALDPEDDTVSGIGKEKIWTDLNEQYKKLETGEISVIKK